MFTKSVYLYFLLSLCLFPLTTISAFSKDNKPGPRKIEVLYNFDDPNEQPRIKIGVDTEIVKPILFKNDQVTLLAYKNANGSNTKLTIDYEIIGDDAKVNLQKYFENFFPVLYGTDGKKKAYTKTMRVFVDDDLLPGGKLIITYSLKIKNNNNFETTETQKVILNVQDEYPFIFTSTGVAASIENSRTVAFIETKETVTYTLNGEELKAKKKILGYENDQKDLKLRQSLIQFLHFRIAGWIYGTVGVPLNEKVFSEPYFGISGFLRRGSIGIVINAGVRMFKEITIDPATGYEIGDPIDLTENLTPDNIKTIISAKWPLFIGISFKF